MTEAEIIKDLTETEVQSKEPSWFSLPHRAAAQGCCGIYLSRRSDEREQRVLACHPDHSLRSQALALHRPPRDPWPQKSRAPRNRAAVQKKRRQEQFAVPAESEVKKQNPPPRGNCAYKLTGATCHGGRWKWTTQLKIDYSRKKKTQRLQVEKARDNKDIFISTVLIVEVSRFFLSAVRTFLWDQTVQWKPQRTGQFFCSDVLMRFGRQEVKSLPPFFIPKPRF